MKKTVVLAAMVVVFVFTFNPLVWAKEMPITEENISQLKGNWEGYRRGMNDMGMMIESLTDLEIFNDTPPFKCEFVYYGSKKGGFLRVPFNNGIIEEGKFF